jgi:hypothetical protein
MATPTLAKERVWIAMLVVLIISAPPFIKILISLSVRDKLVKILCSFPGSLKKKVTMD